MQKNSCLNWQITSFKTSPVKIGPILVELQRFEEFSENSTQTWVVNNWIQALLNFMQKNNCLNWQITSFKTSPVKIGPILVELQRFEIFSENSTQTRLVYN
jgi:hypothetical protein